MVYLVMSKFAERYIAVQRLLCLQDSQLFNHFARAVFLYWKCWPCCLVVCFQLKSFVPKCDIHQFKFNSILLGGS